MIGGFLTHKLQLSSLNWSFKAGLGGAAKWIYITIQHSSGQEEPVRPHQLSLRSSLLCGAQQHNKRFAIIEIITDPYQNCERGPHHEAGDESLHT